MTRKWTTPYEVFDGPGIPSHTITVEVPEPRPAIRLSGKDGNAFAILGTVTAALKKAGCSKEHRDAFMREAMSGDYDHLLQTCMKYADVS